MSTAIDYTTQLHMIPIRNQKLTIGSASHNADALVVEVQLKYNGLIGVLASAVNARRKRRYELLGISRELFESLDGVQTVEALVDRMVEEEKLTFLESRALTVLYLSDLMKRGLIVMVPASENDVQG
jgi:hypothetical protein